MLVVKEFGRGEGGGRNRQSGAPDYTIAGSERGGGEGAVWPKGRDCNAAQKLDP